MLESSIDSTRTLGTHGMAKSGWAYKKDGTFKVSVRTHESLDAAKFCAAFGGGGHARAAGCQFECSLEEAKKAVLDEMKKYF